jgi:hypothetical protein
VSAPAERHLLKAGRLVMIDSGCYSDYSVTGFFVVLRQFVPHDELDKFQAANKDVSDWRGFDRDKYLATLIADGFLLEIDSGNIYLGEYSNADDFRVSP